MPGVTLPAQRPLNLLCKRGTGDTAAERGWVQVLHASLVPSSCDKHHKIWPSRLVLLQSTSQAAVFWLLNYSSRRGLHLPSTACVGTEATPKTWFLGETRCQGARGDGDNFRIPFLCLRTCVLSPLLCSLLPLHPYGGGKQFLFCFCHFASENQKTNELLSRIGPYIERTPAGYWLHSQCALYLQFAASLLPWLILYHSVLHISILSQTITGGTCSGLRASNSARWRGKNKKEAEGLA